MSATTLILLKPHRHGGVDYKQGDRLQVDGTDAKWLIDNGIGKIAALVQPLPHPGSERPYRSTPLTTGNKAKTTETGE